MKKKIWFNHWFSTAYSIIELLRAGDPDRCIIGTNERSHAVYKNVCDEFYTEPIFSSDEEYVGYCLEFCREHKIDVFVPRRRMCAISKCADRFEAEGVKLLAEKYETVSVFSDKRSTYELFSRLGIGNIPEYYCVTDTKGFVSAYEKLSGKYSNVCFKFVRDEGGESYHMIDNTIKRFDMLYHHNMTRLTYDDTILMLSQRENFPPMMVMPYLPGDEVSADCLHTSSGNIVIPRIKSMGAPERLTDDPVIISQCSEILDKTGLMFPCNIQFRYLDGIPHILEVNTRMSGGVQLSCAAAGVNIPSAAVDSLFGIEREHHAVLDTGKILTHALLPVIMDE